MSTKITAIYDRLIVDIEAAISGYTRIPNPYEADQNPELFLRKGYGLGIGPAENTRRMVCAYFSMKRIFTIVLINQILTTDMNSTARGNCERDMMEDHYSLIKYLEGDNNLGGNAVKTIFTDDSGIQFVEGEIGKYVMCEINIEVEYLESIN